MFNHLKIVNQNSNRNFELQSDIIKADILQSAVRRQFKA